MPRALLPCLVLLTALPALAQDDEAYQQAMERCEEAKAKGDFAAMAAAIREALKHGPGTEYTWRSLSWAMGLMGQWQDSLVIARQNVARHGASGWSLAQLAEAQIGASDYTGARDSLARIGTLPPEAIGTSQGAIDSPRRPLMVFTQRTL